MNLFIKIVTFASLTEYALYKDVASMAICVATPYHYHFFKRCHSPVNVTHRQVILTNDSGVTSVAYYVCVVKRSRNSNNANVPSPQASCESQDPGGQINFYC